jgi:hypothetical protein
MKRLIITTALALTPALAFAQSAPPRSSPFVVERLENRFVVAPDFKVTEIDGDTGALAGGYAGWLAEDTLLVGGAAYWLADGPSGSRLAYGGLIVGWSTPAEHRLQFGARGLVGVGRGRLDTDITRFARGRGFEDQFARFGSRNGVRPDLTRPDLAPTTVRVAAEDDFFVFEPQLTLVTKLTDRFGITWGAGYRLTGYTDVLDDRLRGVTGSVAIQWGGW